MTCCDYGKHNQAYCIQSAPNQEVSTDPPELLLCKSAEAVLGRQLTAVSM